MTTMDDNSKLLNDIENAKTEWQTYSKNMLDRVIDYRKFVYDSQSEAESIILQGSIKNMEKVTLSPLRNTINRVKTDFRDLQPAFNLTPRVPPKTSTEVQLNKAIMDKIIFTKQNISNIYSGYDDVCDMSFGVLKLEVEYHWDDATKQVIPDILISRVPDIKQVYFDCSQELREINEKGRFCGIVRQKKIVDDSGYRIIEVIDHFEKFMDVVEYGDRFDEKTGEFICEKKQEGYVYNATYYVDEVVSVKHLVFEERELVCDEEWSFKCLPLILCYGVAFDDYNVDTEKRLTLVPFGENVMMSQKMLDYAATQQLYNLKMSRGSTKAMYTPAMIKGKEKFWLNRNSSEDDLPINHIRDSQGNIIPNAIPQFVPDVSISPVVSEVMSFYPGLISSLSGNELEQDITYNKSGEAIRQAQQIRSKNSKLYTDIYLNEILDFLGSLLTKYYIPKVYSKTQYIAIDNFGDYQVVEINAKDGTNNVKDIIKNYDVRVMVGSIPEVNREKTSAALQSIYTALLPTPLGPQAVANTIDIYANSFDTPDRYEIVNRLKPLVPEPIRLISSGKETEESLKAKAEAQNANAPPNPQAQIANAAIEAEMIKAEAERMKGQGAYMRGQADLVEAQAKYPNTVLETNAEITKAELEQQNRQANGE